MNRISFLKRKSIIIIMATLLIFGFCVVFLNKPGISNETDPVSISADDLQQYRQNIGDTMDIKKSVLIIFNSLEECQVFINDHGSDADPLAANLGITPLMENGYYNVVGNTVFETVFDNLQDGEYVKTPIEFGGAYCYFKRLENYSVTDKDEDLKEFIKQEKTVKKGGEISDEKNN